MQRLSQELIRQHIEPYSRSPQSNDLCSDIRDYNVSLQHIYEIIRNSLIKKYAFHLEYTIPHLAIFNKMAWIILKNVLKYYKDNIFHFKKIVSSRDMNLFYSGYDDYTLNSIITKQKVEEYVKSTRVLWASIDVSLRKLFIEFMKKKKHVI